ncbi:Hypothetical predicted protein [Scomber scombrus]|uniref:Uncharacterized protein n=1 Tax=Scomber scombrus TaxID=13677 RepID=A0AAV1PTW1_SCOSC
MQKKEEVEEGEGSVDNRFSFAAFVRFNQSSFLAAWKCALPVSDGSFQAAAFRLDRHRVQDASDPCRFLTLTTAFRLVMDIGSRMPVTHDVSSLQRQRFA